MANRAQPESQDSTVAFAGSVYARRASVAAVFATLSELLRRQIPSPKLCGMAKGLPSEPAGPANQPRETIRISAPTKNSQTLRVRRVVG